MSTSTFLVVPALGSVAFPACTVLSSLHHQVISRIWMAFGAVRLCFLQFSRRQNCGSITKAASQVLLKSYRLQVVGVDATSHPAQMINLKPFGDCAFEVLVDESMGKPDLFINGKSSVSTCNQASGPQPATRVWLGGNETPQSVNDGGHISAALAQLRTEEALSRFNGEFVPTHPAIANLACSHVTPFSRIGQGLASVASAIGARSYFPISCAAVQV